MRKSRPISERKSSSLGARLLTAVAINLERSPVYSLGQDEFARIIVDALRRSVGAASDPVKAVARAANANIHTARNWWTGATTPQGLYLLRLMAAMPELQSEIRRLVGMEASLDPEFGRDLDAMIQTYLRLHRAGGK